MVFAFNHMQIILSLVKVLYLLNGQ